MKEEGPTTMKEEGPTTMEEEDSTTMEEEDSTTMEEEDSTTMEEESDDEPDSSIRPPRYTCSENARHLFELSSISIHNKFPHAQIQCSLNLIDDNNESFQLLNKDCINDALCLSDDFLEIKLGKSKLNLPRLLPKHFFLEVTIQDMSRQIDNVIMEESFKLDFTGEVVYDEQQWCIFDTKENGYVKVCYTIFRYAFFTYVDFKVLKNEQEDDLHALVNGTITATRKLWNQSVPRVLTTLFDETMLDSTGLLWASCFPVPAYSYLKIHAKLKINNEMIETGEDGLEIKAMDNYRCPYKNEIKGKKWRIVVKVTMTHDKNVLSREVSQAYHKKPVVEGDRKFYSSGKFISDSENISMSGEELDIQHGPQEKKLRTRYVYVGHPCMSFMRYNLGRLPRSRSVPLVELFSISACPYVDNTDKHSPLLLYGRINVVDVNGSYDIFHKEKKFPLLSRPHEKIPLLGIYRCYMGSYFLVTIKLKDGCGRRISKGVMPWDLSFVKNWRDRRLSSVVRGKYGFAAIHFIMFSDAVQANVKVSLKSKAGCACKVNGKIWAKYIYNKYSTRDDKKYFQSVLFQKAKSELVELLDGVDVPLLKSVVAVPFTDVLVVKLDLCIVFADKEELLKGKACFKPQESKFPPIGSGVKFEGPSCDVMVFVEWGDSGPLPPAGAFR